MIIIIKYKTSKQSHMATDTIFIQQQQQQHDTDV